MSERDIAREIERRLNADPAIQEVLRAIGYGTRQPRYRFWQTPDGAMFIFTTEKFPDGKYGSAIYQPTGKGARSGRRAVTEWKPIREVHHRTRRAARARALALYEARKAEINR